jgi:hypothetical protein
MASGFIEPLEAAALIMVELNATMIAEQLPANRNVMDIVAKRYNDKFLYRWNRIIDFLKLHYILSERRDSDYWNDNVAVQSIPESLAEQIALWRWQTPWHRDTLHLDEMFPSASFQYILYGMGFKTHPSLTSRRSERDVRDKAARLFEENTEQTKKLIASMPTNRELIDKVKKFGFQKI